MSICVKWLYDFIVCFPFNVVVFGFKTFYEVFLFILSVALAITIYPVQLLIDNQVIQTIEISKKTVQLASGSKEAYACQINVAAAHKAINATDAK